ncbi:DUF4238 domain-containing protein [Legionella jamestowniensis]|uniref:DUF4238 domain-containing protein n=1 Tax=Legionella jamestowniensis TaxID=455 RepID=A0A0W0UGU1_9GAMM|nr:DUF4238 domain-containing protein [Legionella jamestowniensis]KTD07080.1 hypothetical protein Ljam_1275 [Legionella jamestowniensis]SFL70626.1 Protein of unknown function [Legionella jamestowniensis DSM 19215]
MARKRQHYLPTTYLKGFCNQKGMLWTYDKQKYDNPWECKPEKTAFEKYLYNFEDTSTENREIIEKYFAEEIEGPAAEPLENLRNKIFPDKDSRQKLALFFGFLLTRSPMQLAKLKNQADLEFDAFIRACTTDKEYFAEGYKKTGITASNEEIEEDRLAILNGEISLYINRNSSLNNMMALGFIFSEYFVDMKWALIESVENAYITTDNLLNILNHSNLEHRFANL